MAYVRDDVAQKRLDTLQAELLDIATKMREEAKIWDEPGNEMARGVSWKYLELWRRKNVIDDEIALVRQSIPHLQ